MATYTPNLPPASDNVADLRDWLLRELQLIAESQLEQTAVELRPIFAEPERPVEGMLVFADGTEWNPGSGAGTYEYRGGAWVKL